MVKGKPITVYADQNHLTISERLKLFEQVCHAVQHAHHKGIIHRDLKPANVLVSTHGGRPYAKVIDFGIAKAVAQQLTNLTLYTLHDQFVGTPQYMSPEQASGSIDIDTPTDVYSLGVMLYERLTGSTPFAKEELKEAGLERIKQMIMEIAPPKPSTRISISAPTLDTLAASRRVEPKRLGSLVRGELDWIVMKALEKDRKRRYETPINLANDAIAHLNGEPVNAAPPSRAYQFQKFVRRHRGPVIAGAAISSALGIGLIGTTWGYFRAKRMANLEQAAKEEVNQARESEAEQRRTAEFELEAYIVKLSLAPNSPQNKQFS
jgi:serine/threonine protein kinase